MYVLYLQVKDIETVQIVYKILRTYCTISVTNVHINQFNSYSYSTVTK